MSQASPGTPRAPSSPNPLREGHDNPFDRHTQAPQTQPTISSHQNPTTEVNPVVHPPNLLDSISLCGSSVEETKANVSEHHPDLNDLQHTQSVQYHQIHKFKYRLAAMITAEHKTHITQLLKSHLIDSQLQEAYATGHEHNIKITNTDNPLQAYITQIRTEGRTFAPPKDVSQHELLD